jgi:hypothetical protein
MISGNCISHLKMLSSVSRTYCGDPSKKPPPPEKRKYNPVGDWTPAVQTVVQTVVQQEQDPK